LIWNSLYSYSRCWWYSRQWFKFIYFRYRNYNNNSIGGGAVMRCWNAGGSGGGGGYSNQTGGTGTANQGYDGGVIHQVTRIGGGGGGAGQVGQLIIGSVAGAGGYGVASTITGSCSY
jgi:hypothetical protein